MVSGGPTRMLAPLGQGRGYPMETGCQPAGLRERLEAEKSQLDARSEQIGEILNALDKQPEVGRILDLISELGGF